MLTFPAMNFRTLRESFGLCLPGCSTFDAETAQSKKEFCESRCAADIDGRELSGDDPCRVPSSAAAATPIRIKKNGSAQFGNWSAAPVIRLFVLSLALALGSFSVKADERPAFQQGFAHDPANAEMAERAIGSFLEDSPFTEAEAERHIRTTIEYWIKNEQVATVWAEASDGSYEGRRERPIVQYTSVDEFLAANPRCCYFHTHSSDGYRPGPWFRFWNNYLGIASINKIRITYADTGETIIHSGVGFFIDADGKVIESPPTGR